MTITGFDADKCQQRNRVAAKRDGIEAAPLTLYRQQPPPQGTDADLRYAHGTLPSSPEQALERINAERTNSELTLDDVWIHYAEAANGNFVADRYLFLDGTTLRNIGQDALAGVAFMNSHRVGGLSHPSELPFGRTFAGRYEQTKGGQERALLAFYMLRGIYPNGQSGPSTDDLHRMIDAGTLFDVSVGLYGGDSLCEVCGGDVNSADCPHTPGTTHGMDADAQTAQQARGVPNGAASYRLINARMGEVSAVFDGAVPGAGFRKTLSLARRRQLTPVELAQARHAYAALLAKGDLSMDDVTDAVQHGFTRALKSLGFRQDEREYVSPVAVPGELLQASVVGELKPVPDPALEQALAAERERSAALVAQVTKLAEQSRVDFVDGLVRAHQLLPARKAWALARLAQAAADDAALPGAVAFVTPDGTAREGSRVEAVQAELTAAPAHDFLTKDTVPAGSGLFAVGATDPDSETAKKAEAEFQRLLGMTPLGQSVQQERK